MKSRSDLDRREMKYQCFEYYDEAGSFPYWVVYQWNDGWWSEVWMVPLGFYPEDTEEDA